MKQLKMTNLESVFNLKRFLAASFNLLYVKASVSLT